MDPAAQPSFAALLRTFRVARGLSQEALAKQAGLSLDAISLLERGLRLSPREDTVRLLARTLQLRADEWACFFSAAAQGRRHGPRVRHAMPVRSAPLPSRLTSFVGRQQELAEVCALVLKKRLVTLTGAGGIGKSSLALAVASQVQPQFPDGAALVELAPLTDGALVPQAIASALGVRDQPGEPIIVTLGRILAASRRLLILDNCEHLLQPCAEVAEALLGACPGVSILATSREPLRVGAEVIRRVPALSLPEGDTAALDEIRRSEAVALFVERAEAASSGFALTQANAAAIAEICRRLDGIPLALELAAARVEVLPPQQLARRLDDRFHLLTAGSRTALPRHRTVGAMLDWSHDLLTAPERALLRRLAVFAGGFTLEAATAVCADRADAEQAPLAGGAGPSSALPEREAPAVLLGLVDKSLVQVEARDGDARYRLLETIREYAREKLDHSGEAAPTRAAHAAYFVAWAGGPRPPAPELPEEREATGPPVAALAGEADNLRTALHYLLGRGEAALGLGLAARIYHLWFERGPREEGRGWLRRFLALPAAAAAPERAAALYPAGHLAQAQGDLADGEAAFAQLAIIGRERDDRRAQALAHIHLGKVAFLQGELARARAELEVGLRRAREAQAPAVLLEGLAHVGILALEQGDLAQARAALTEARAAMPGQPRMRHRFCWLAGDLALAEGDGDRAAREYRAALAAGTYPAKVAISTLKLAAVAASAGDGEQAARLLGRSEGIGLAVGGQPIIAPIYQWAQHARVEAAVRALLGEDALARLRAEGARLGMEGVARLALGEEGDG